MKFQEIIKQQLKLFDSNDFIKDRESEDETMLKHLEILKEINKNGFITTNSQAGNRHKTDLIDHQERSYLTGFMREKDAILFIKKMGIYTDKVVAEICETDISPICRIPVTILKYLKTDKISIETKIDFQLSKNKLKNELKHLNIELNKDEKIVWLECYDPIWLRNASDKDGLFSQVLYYLKDKKDNFMTWKDRMKEQKIIIKELIKKTKEEIIILQKKLNIKDKIKIDASLFKNRPHDYLDELMKEKEKLEKR